MQDTPLQKMAGICLQLPVLYTVIIVCLAYIPHANAYNKETTINDVRLADITAWFPQATALAPLENNQAYQKPAYRKVLKQQTIIGVILLSHLINPIPAYSGLPIATLIGIDTLANIRGVSIVHHDEPILVIGIKSTDIDHFTQQYINVSALDKVRVNARNRKGYTAIDGISGATITAMVLNRSIMSSSFTVIKQLGWSPQQNFPNNLTSPDNTTQSTTSSMSEQTSTTITSSLNATEKNFIGELTAAEQFLTWQDNSVKIILLTIGLCILLIILFFQDWLVRRPALFTNVRIGYLIFTVFFIGYFLTAQLSIINVLAFIQTFKTGFTWETLLIDPGLFILWSFVAISILLWGRGVFCGWLCPFGALQELINRAAKRLGVPNYDFPSAVHERLWAIKYLLLILLAGVSLESFTYAARIAEIEPFKTTFSLLFLRDWSYVIYAIALLVISAINGKFFCKYLCTLGASLSIFGRLRIFDWLKRKNECGKPCQACAAICQVGAIKPTGEIIDNECHHCLECQVLYWDENRCQPLVIKRKRRALRKEKKQQIPVAVIE